ncbi:hypothetical protein BN946_scf184983.g17 [Trametes cinnabarina]|uniref:Uncharacterized protein n=1 Tax=Pycnoporus cinnabarinus TaxID=5643 RepID=A0A060SJX7_PYCCI|nr:hypothetical protein BN946_scf184983.g17 [Trametes cinnabarina]
MRANATTPNPHAQSESSSKRHLVGVGKVDGDQWDIYKLDPAYDCFIPQWPGDPVITRKDPQPQPERRASSADEERKRRSPTSLSDSEDHAPHIHKKFRRVVNLVTDEEGTEIESAPESDEEDEVEEIVAEEFSRDGVKSANGSKTAQEHRRDTRRKKEREKLKANMTSSSFESHRSKTPEIVDLTMEDDSPPLDSASNGVPPAGPTKRKVFATEDSPSVDRAFQPNKKMRIEPDSSDAVRRKRAQRERHRAEQTKERFRMREDWERKLREELLAHSQGYMPNGSQDSHSVNGESAAAGAQEGPNGSQPMDAEEAQRQAAIEESRRKLAELEKDRPLWEQEARKRAAQERAEEEARLRRKEEERRRAASAMAEEERQRQRAAAAAAEAERRARAEKERIALRAIERYKTLSEEFDSAKFTSENPVMFETIPWPVLHSPVSLRVEDIDWSSVEDFFAAARRHMRPQDYKVFVEKSHKRFHPDRWRARGVLKSIEDEELRGCLEVAANTVAQALTPIWREVRG